ncbi:hypothetical protein JTB14_015697 [Gonioctena quinquepunctata]|nr:hypothetical protein JTB14_015697 [Gonioctena quinquepunctata]
MQIPTLYYKHNLLKQHIWYVYPSIRMAERAFMPSRSQKQAVAAEISSWEKLQVLESEITKSEESIFCSTSDTLDTHSRRRFFDGEHLLKV